MKKPKEMQRTAISKPAIMPEDCQDERYRRESWPWSIILTFNRGFE